MPTADRRTALALGLTAAAYRRVPGANDRVRVGVVGCGGRGRFVLQRLLQHGAAVSVLCDPDRNQIARAQKLLPAVVPAEADFRPVAEGTAADAVLIATPDHWHALPFINAVRAGKAVYLEKPTAYSVAESRAMLDAAGKSRSVVQFGTQQRSADHFRHAAEFVRGGGLGTVSRVRFWNVFNNTGKGSGGRAGGIGSPPDGPAPAGVDYDRWLGPAPARPFNPNRFHWNYVYFWDYAGGMMTGWGVHHMDIIHWALGADAPRTVAAAGGTFAVRDGRETPDTLDALFEYDRFVVQGSMYHGNARPIEGRDTGVAFYGTAATLVIDRAGYEVWPEGDPKGTTRHPGREQDADHARNFLDAVRGRAEPVTDLLAGHRASIPALLANIAFRVGRKLRWDADRERFVGDPEADKLLGREYRKPWALPD
jgi:predicted dehydrogenase